MDLTPSSIHSLTHGVRCLYQVSQWSLLIIFSGFELQINDQQQFVGILISPG
jgi:hypothetical protein